MTLSDQTPTSNSPGISAGSVSGWAPRRFSRRVWSRDRRRTGQQTVAYGDSHLRRTRDRARDLRRRRHAFKRRQHRAGVMAMTSLLGVTAIDYYCADKLSSKTPTADTTHERRIRIAQSIIVGGRPEEVYGFWRSFENLPRFMNHLESVKETSNRQTHWRTRAPGGSSVEWDAEITADEPNRRISWRSLPGSTVENSGIVWFERATGSLAFMRGSSTSSRWASS